MSSTIYIMLVIIHQNSNGRYAMVFWSLRVNIPWFNCQLGAFIFLFLTVNMYISYYLWIIRLIITMVWLSIKCQSHTTLDSINTACSKLKLCLGICADMVCYKINISPCLHFRRQLSFNLCRLSCFCRQTILFIIHILFLQRQTQICCLIFWHVIDRWWMSDRATSWERSCHV